MTSVFIVEDDDSLRNLYQMALELKGYEIAGSAKDGDEAVNMFKKFPVKPDIIIMDHRMPVKNGLDATKEIIEMDGSSRIIFASADKAIKEKAFSLGVCSFKQKPFSLEKLCSNIEKHSKDYEYRISIY